MQLTFRKALQLLCDEILKRASPSHGEPPPKIGERRDHDRPTHVPAFHQFVLQTRSQVNQLTEDQSRATLLTLLARIILEAEARFPHTPAYWYLALDICYVKDFPELDKWFMEQLLRRSKPWGDIDRRKFEQIVDNATRKIMTNVN